mmetsp:Transcript_85335/g.225069  ORF Transcript_85335/g.225069 Transcript_85335/m.225069 type:complete len:209 (+) Transcript_85335:2-628(+)
MSVSLYTAPGAKRKHCDSRHKGASYTMSEGRGLHGRAAGYSSSPALVEQPLDLGLPLDVALQEVGGRGGGRAAAAGGATAERICCVAVEQIPHDAELGVAAPRAGGPVLQPWLFKHLFGITAYFSQQHGSHHAPVAARPPQPLRSHRLCRRLRRPCGLWRRCCCGVDLRLAPLPRQAPSRGRLDAWGPPRFLAHDLAVARGAGHTRWS